MAGQNNGAVRVPQEHGGALVFRPKGSPSLNPGGFSKERRMLAAAIETHCVPQVLQALDSLLTAWYEDGNIVAIRLWLEQVRPAPKSSTSDEVERAVEEKLVELIQAERARRAGEQKP